MRLRDDERAQSIQVGAVLLFGILVISFTTYQAFVVPDQNQEVEFDHNLQVHDEMLDVRNAIVSMPGGGSPQSTSVTLGTTYPSRAVALNPPPASGQLRTVGTTDPRVNVSITNATASGETGDVWDGTTRAYNSGGVVYRPGYNVYDGAPVTAYENTLLYNSFDSGTLVVANQTFIDDDEVSLVMVNGSLSRSSTAATGVDVRPVSSSTESVEVSPAGSDSPITIIFTSRLSATEWERILSDEDAVVDVGELSAASVPDPFRLIRVELDASQSYRLRLTKVGVGSGVTGEEAAYLTDVEGDGATVSRGESREITLAVRDDYNNPVAGVPVNASVGAGKGSFESTRLSTDGDGRVTFEYRTTQSTETGTHRLNFTIDESSVLSTRPFDAAQPRNASTTVTVTSESSGGSAGAYSVDWANPADSTENDGATLSSCSSDACTWDVGASDDGTLALDASLSPAYEGVRLEFAVSNSTVGTVSPDGEATGADGTATTTLTANENGTVDVLASGNDGSDTITIEVENVSSGAGSGQTSADQMELVPGSGSIFWGGEGVEFDVHNNDSSSVSVVAVTLESTSEGRVADVWESQTGSDSQGQHEVYVDSSTSGVLDLDGQPYWQDSGTPLEFGVTEQMTENATFAGDTTGTVSLYAFRNNGGQAVDMSGSTVTVRLHFEDGSDRPYTVNVS